MGPPRTVSFSARTVGPPHVEASVSFRSGPTNRSGLSLTEWQTHRSSILFITNSRTHYSAATLHYLRREADSKRKMNNITYEDAEVVYIPLSPPSPELVFHFDTPQSSPAPLTCHDIENTIDLLHDSFAAEEDKNKKQKQKQKEEDKKKRRRKDTCIGLTLIGNVFGVWLYLVGVFLLSSQTGSLGGVEGVEDAAAIPTITFWLFIGTGLIMLIPPVLMMLAFRAGAMLKAKEKVFLSARKRVSRSFLVR